jgi:hypothetical protein
VSVSKFSAKWAHSHLPVPPQLDLIALGQEEKRKVKHLLGREKANTIEFGWSGETLGLVYGPILPQIR